MPVPRHHKPRMSARATNGNRINRGSLRVDLRNKFELMAEGEERTFTYETASGEKLEVTIEKGETWRDVKQLSMEYREDSRIVLNKDIRDLAWHIENQFAELTQEMSF